MKFILDKVKFYLPVFIALILSIVIFRALFKKYVSKPKKTVEGFEEEVTSMTILNELRTLLMNNETEYQNRMNSVLEKLVALEVQIMNDKMQKISTTAKPPAEPPTEAPVETPTSTSIDTSKATTPVTAPATTPATAPATAPTTPTQVPSSSSNLPKNDAQLNDDEDSDVESNVSDEDTNEPFVDGITSCATANCYMI